MFRPFNGHFQVHFKNKNGSLAGGSIVLIRFLLCGYRAFSYDVTAAILVFQNKETAAILVYQAIPSEIRLYFYEKSSFVLANQYGRWSRE